MSCSLPVGFCLLPLLLLFDSIDPMLKNQTIILLTGDLVTLILVTLVGFASHNELGTAGSRMLTTYFPLAAAWLLVAPHLGVFDPAKTGSAKHLWRPFWAMVLAGPMAGWMRGVMLNAMVSPLFVVILGGVSALSLLAWRGIYVFFSRQTRPSAHG
jgi:hypothetical protein